MRKQVKLSKIDIGYEKYGSSDSLKAILLHGFPYDIEAYEEVYNQLSKENLNIYVPYLQGFGSRRLVENAKIKSGQQGALASDLLEFMNELGIGKAILVGYDWGGRAACIVSAIWPNRVIGLVTGGGYNIQNIKRSYEPALPEIEQRYWYQYYFQSQRGKLRLEKYRAELCKLLWTHWSPNWKFSDDEFNKTAKSFGNLDFIDVVIHSYRHRFSLAEGDPDYEYIEKELAKTQKIEVPTIIIEGKDDGVDLVRSSNQYDYLFTRLIERIVAENVGHNIPQEDLKCIAAAIKRLKNSKY